MATMKDDFVLVPHFPGQRKDVLEVYSNGDSIALVHWTDMTPSPRHGSFRRFLYDGTPLGPVIDASADMLANGLFYDRSRFAFLPDGKVVAVHYVARDTFLTQANMVISVHRAYMQTFDSTGNRGVPIQLADTLDAWWHWGLDMVGVSASRDGKITVLFWDWGGSFTDNSGIHGELYLAQYDTLGNGLGPWQKVTGTVPDGAYAEVPRLGSNKSGRFVVTWDANAPGLVLQVPYFRVFDDLTPVTDPIPFTCGDTLVLNCGTLWEPCFRGASAFPAVLSDGSFAVAFAACGDDYFDSAGSIHVSYYDPQAELQWGPKQVNGFATHVVGLYPRILNDGDSAFLVSWVGYPWYPLEDLFLQRVSLNGGTTGFSYRANSFIGQVGQAAFFEVLTYGDNVMSYWYDYRDYVTYDRDVYSEVFSRSLLGIKQAGDVNYDGYVNTSDVIHLVNYIFKSGPPPYGFVSGGDMNGSCTTNSADIICLVNYIFKSGPAPVEPCSS